MIVCFRLSPPKLQLAEATVAHFNMSLICACEKLEGKCIKTKENKSMGVGELKDHPVWVLSLWETTDVIINPWIRATFRL